MQQQLSKKDEKHIEKTLNKTLEMLENQEELMFSGELIDDIKNYQIKFTWAMYLSKKIHSFQ
ncbi:MAG: hypothetical protein LLF98_00790 [Clostridium sp.]|uniref:hypothetical protein n=1 Tax=Clostridium sp. TaxID=1506 RepID=UPI0025BECD11|nr:hypothetical protein [Clostridium sp.]MCE5219824.1 hypothetical protein [Clostridium sp.]